MKPHLFSQSMLLFFLSLALFNLGCGPGTKNTAAPLVDKDKILIDGIQNPQLKLTMRNFKKGDRLENSDLLLLALNEGNNESNQISIISFFMARSGKNIPQAYMNLLLLKAIEQRKSDMVKYLLVNGKINLKAEDFLHEAIIWSPLDVVKALVSRGADLNASSPTKGTPLHYLLAAPSKIDGKATNSLTVRTEILSYLLAEPKIIPSIQNQNKETPTQLASILAGQNDDEYNASRATTTKELRDFYNGASSKIAAAERAKSKK